MDSNPLRLMALAVFAVLALGCAGTPESEAEAAAAAMPEATSGPEATAAAARSPAVPTDPGQTFADMDANKDGGLSQDELAGNEMLRAHFSVADKDGNGSLSAAEVEAHRTEMSGRPR